MNLPEHLLTLLIEECSELQQAASKILRFGIDNTCPKTKKTNREEFTSEFHDLLAVMALLEENGVIERNYTSEGILKSMAKKRDFMRLSEKCGTLKID